MSTCPYCTETAPDGEACYQRHGDLVCTRAPGHDGPHVACAIHEHQTETWGDPMSITNRARAEAEKRPTIALARVIAAWDQGVETTDRIPHWAVGLAAHLLDYLAASLPPTDEEVEAAREAVGDLLLQLGVDPDEQPEHGGPTPGEVIARAALTAARETQR